MVKNIFANVYKDKKVLITGHTGFKGSWLSLWLEKLGAKVVGVSKDIPTKPSLFENLSFNNRPDETYFNDVRDIEKLKEIWLKEKPDFVFHLAAQPIVGESYANPLETLTTNIIGTANVLEAARVLNMECTFVMITSDKCYENVEWIWGYRENDHLGGKDIYSGSKACAEHVVNSYYHSFFSKNSKIRIATARAGNVIGGGDWSEKRIIPDCYRSWSKNEPVVIRSPNSTRPWQHVLEPLSGYLLLGQYLYQGKIASGESFNFGPKDLNSITVSELIVDLYENSGLTGLEVVYTSQDNSTFSEANLLKLNCDKANNYLSWEPVLKYEEVIRLTSSWYGNFFKKGSDIENFTKMQIDAYETKAMERNIIWTK